MNKAQEINRHTPVAKLERVLNQYIPDFMQLDDEDAEYLSRVLFEWSRR